LNLEIVYSMKKNYGQKVLWAIGSSAFNIKHT